jgi:hypothetical protein
VEAMGLLVHGTGSAILTPGRIVITGNRIDHVLAVDGDQAAGIVLDGGAENVVDGNVVTEVFSGTATPFPFQRANGLYIASFAANSLTEVGGNTVRNSVTRSNSSGITLNTHGDQYAFVRDSAVGGMSIGLSLGGSCIPYYLYNTISGAATPYEIAGSSIPCTRGTIDPGPGNVPAGP